MAAPENATAPMGEEEDLTDLLLEGARYDCAEDVLLALERNVNVNVEDYNKRTALHMASANGHLDMCRTLIDAGADVAAKNEEGNTPLHYACLNGHTEIVKLLMQHGASASELNRHARTPVDEALGRPFRDSVVAVVNSFFKQPLVDMDLMQLQQDGARSGTDHGEQEQHAMEEEEEMKDESNEYT